MKKIENDDSYYNFISIVFFRSQSKEARNVETPKKNTSVDINSTVISNVLDQVHGNLI